MLKNLFVLLFVLLNLYVNAQTKPAVTRKVKTIIVDAGHGGKDFGAHGGQTGGLGSYEKNITLAISLKLVKKLRDSFPELNIVPTRTTDIYQSPSEKANIANYHKGDLFICIHADAAPCKKRTITTIDSVEEVYTVMEGEGDQKVEVEKTRIVAKKSTQVIKEGTKRNGVSCWIFAPHKTGAKMAAIMKEEKNYVVLSEYDSSSYNKIDFSTPERKAIAMLYQKRYQEKSYSFAEFILKNIAKRGRNDLGIHQREVGIWVLQATNMPAVLVETGFITNNIDERYLNSEKGQEEISLAIVEAVRQYRKKYDKEALMADDEARKQKQTQKNTASVTSETTVPKF